MKIAIIISVIVVVAIIGFLIYKKSKKQETVLSNNNTNSVQPNLNTQSRKCETGYNTSSGFVGGFFYTDNKGPCTP